MEPNQKCSQLPSYSSAVAFVRDPNLENTLKVAGSWVGRAALVSTGMLLAGKSLEDSVKNGLIAASAIEFFVLGWALKSK